MLGTRHPKELVPWQAKVGLKLLLSRLPASYRLWQSLALFRHGKMDEPAYAYDVFIQHLQRSDFARRGQPFVALELGPGDSLFSALIAKAMGAERSWLVDVGRFAHEDMGAYQQMAAYLASKGLYLPPLPSTLPELLTSCDATYCTDGLRSLRDIPESSVDLVLSQAVLEHIRRHEFLPMMRELRRVLRPDGCCSHRVDLRDHLSGNLNNLRFPEAVWEADWMARSGFYTNRIQFDEMCRLFEDAGFAVSVLRLDRWRHLPTPRRALARPFKSMPVESLLVRSFDVVLRPRP